MIEPKEITDTTKQKRHRSRIYPGSLVWAVFQLPGSTEEFDATICDVSDGGLCLVSGIKVEPRTFIKVFPGDQDKGIFGEVRWCVPDAWGLPQTYDLGVKAIRWVAAK